MGKHYKSFFFKDSFNHRKNFMHSIKSKDGFLSAVQLDSDRGDLLFLGGAYQGRFNIDPAYNDNAIDTAYFISSLHPDPLEVLQLGLKDGAWASFSPATHPPKVWLSLTQIMRTARIIDRYSDIKPLHSDKVNIFFEEGRKYLTRLGPTKYDIIIVNNDSTTQDGTTRYLSKEFILLAARHLKEGGLLAVNSDGCPHVSTTMAQFFSFAVKKGDFVVGAYGNMEAERGVLSQRLESFRPQWFSCF